MSLYLTPYGIFGDSFSFVLYSQA